MTEVVDILIFPLPNKPVYAIFASGKWNKEKNNNSGMIPVFIIVSMDGI